MVYKRERNAESVTYESFRILMVSHIFTFLLVPLNLVGEEREIFPQLATCQRDLK